MAVNFVPFTYADRATANSYATTAEFDLYLANRLNAPTIATEEEKQLLLIAGTKRLEAELYLGSRTYTDGVLKFPRSGLPDNDGFVFEDDVIPADVKNALFETAIYSNSNDVTESNDMQNYTKAKVGELEATFKNNQLSINDTLTSAVWQYLAPFLDYQSGLRVTR
jgi:hypothetical protein